MIDLQNTSAGAEDFCLQSRDDGEAPVLTGVAASGRLEGVLFTLTLRQTYRNAGSAPIEVVYTFPLAPHAVLLGLAAELDGRRLDGRIVPRAQGEREYEQALADGDAPVLLEQAGDGGLHTANIGNLLPGEQITLELRTAQLLHFEQGRLRVALPTTIAPRHGRPAAAGLLPHQVPEATLEASYPLALEVAVMGSLAAGQIDCPSHAHRQTRIDGGLQLTLAPGATLDRDVVFVVTPPGPQPACLLQGRDAVGERSGAGTVALAAFNVPAGATRPQARLKLLVDCSGSMAGDSMASARRALHGVVAGLRHDDAVSFSRFGSSLQPVTPLLPVSAPLVQALHDQVDATDANLGGTEMAAALLGLMNPAHPTPAGSADAGADILLITDGEAWDTAQVVDAARRSGHRLFAIGVGAAPATDVLLRMAERTGGACEFAIPGESLAQAALRMLVRIRQRGWADLRVDWGAVPRWQVALPGSAYGGDTVIALAGFASLAPPASPVQLFAAGAAGASHQLATASAEGRLAGSDLARIAAAQRLAGLEPQQASDLAVAQSLLSPHTHCVLVHRRAEADRSGEEAQLRRVPSMLAAGWGGMGQVAATATADRLQVFESLSVDRGYVRPSVLLSRSNKMSSQDRFALQAGLLAAASALAPAMTLPELAQAVADHLALGHPVASLAQHLSHQRGRSPWGELIDQLVFLGLDDATAWLVLAMWAARRPTGEAAPGAASPTLAHTLAPFVAALDALTVAKALARLDRQLGAHAPVGGRAARQDRLARRLPQP